MHMALTTQFFFFLLMLTAGSCVSYRIIKFPVYYCCRPDTLDPALLRPGRLDRKVEFSLPELEVFTITTVVICDSYLSCMS